MQGYGELTFNKDEKQCSGRLRAGSLHLLRAKQVSGPRIVGKIKSKISSFITIVFEEDKTQMMN